MDRVNEQSSGKPVRSAGEIIWVDGNRTLGRARSYARGENAAFSNRLSRESPRDLPRRSHAALVAIRTLPDDHSRHTSHWTESVIELLFLFRGRPGLSVALRTHRITLLLIPHKASLRIKPTDYSAYRRCGAKRRTLDGCSHHTSGSPAPARPDTIATVISSTNAPICPACQKPLTPFEVRSGYTTTCGICTSEQVPLKKIGLTPGQCSRCHTFEAEFDRARGLTYCPECDICLHCRGTGRVTRLAALGARFDPGPGWRHPTEVAACHCEKGKELARLGQ